MKVESRAIVSGTSRIAGFHKLEVGQRQQTLADRGDLSAEQVDALKNGGIDAAIADSMIENVIGTYSMPLGIALNVFINDTDYLVPMAIEEPSVVAAASNAAKMIRAHGGFRATSTEPIMIGQVELREVGAPETSKRAIIASQDDILAMARAELPSLCARGGGPTGIEVRILSPSIIVVHLLVDCRDAMGANLVNTLCEALAPKLAEIADATVGLRILSNLSVHRMVTVTATVADSDLGGANVREQVAAASHFAELDPYRAATHNKGIMNGIDAVLLACGQDWRGVEAGAHAYAAQSGSYQPLARWHDDGVALRGELTIPMALGTVGGALHLHQGARVSLALLAVKSATELAMVVAAAGLASNLAALRALATDGIQRGHMSLHARVIARAAGATGDMVERVAEEIAALGDVKPARAKEILDRLRAEPASSGCSLLPTSKTSGSANPLAPAKEEST